jgi:hypothetical protein
VPIASVYPVANARALIRRCGSSKLNAAEFSMQEALSLDSSALHGVVFDRYERPRK